MSLRLTAILTALWISLPAQAERADHPNVIVIMADDIGAEGLACYGSTIYTTPNLDRMAAEGLRFENAYATPLCTPTRVMIMSGLYPPRTGFRALIGKGEGVRMPASIRTFGHDFRAAGYATAVTGKWQLGKFDEFPDQPVEHGFDEYCMWTWVYGDQKSSRYYKPQIYHNSKVINGGERDFGPDYFHDFALDFIDRKKNEPFFLYYPMALVHSPFVHPPKLEKLARTNFRDDLDKQTIAFGHMITYMDHVVGSLLNRLKKHDLDKNTLVLFTGDNGTHKNITSHLPGLKLKGGKGTMTEAGSRVPLLAWWPDTIGPACAMNSSASSTSCPPSPHWPASGSIARSTASISPTTSPAVPARTASTSSSTTVAATSCETNAFVSIRTANSTTSPSPPTPPVTANR